MDKLYIDQTRIKKKQYKLIADVKAEIPLPEKDQRLMIRTQVRMNLLSFFIKVFEFHGGIDDALITTYSFDKNSVVIILGMIRTGKIKRIRILLSNTYYYRYPELYQEIKREMLQLKSEGFDVGLVFATSQLKITLIKCGENYYQMEGSMNYSINNLAEQTSIENDKELYLYDYHILNEVIFRRKSATLEQVC